MFRVAVDFSSLGFADIFHLETGRTDGGPDRGGRRAATVAYSSAMEPLSLLACLVPGHAFQLPCSQQLEVGGRAIMSQTPVSSSRSVVVSRHGRELATDDEYSPGETLNVSLTLAGLDQAQFRTTLGSFNGRPCVAKTAPFLGTGVSSTASVTLLTPTEGRPLQIWAGHASGFEKVSITSKVTLRPGLLASSSPPMPFLLPPNIPSCVPLNAPRPARALSPFPPSTPPMPQPPPRRAASPPDPEALSGKTGGSFRDGALSLLWDSSNTSVARFTLRVERDAYVGLGVTSDGRMSGAPSLIATCAQSPDRCDARHYILEYDFPREQSPAPFPSFSEPMTRREDGSLSVTFALSYTDECDRGLLAICRGGTTKLMIGHGPDSFVSAFTPAFTHPCSCVRVDPSSAARASEPPPCLHVGLISERCAHLQRFGREEKSLSS